MKKDDVGLKHVFVAAGAIIFFACGLPVFDAVSNWLANWFGLKSVKLNHEASKFTEENNQTTTQAIGFQVPNEIEEGEDYEE